MDDVLNIAVQLEKNGEKAYRLAAGKSNQASLCAFMVWMADQEAAHAKWFEQLRDQAGTIEADPGLMEMGRQLLEEVVADQSFSLDDLEISRVATLQESIRVSIEFEKDTVIFYEMLAAFVQQGEVRALMEKIIEEEHRHIRMLQEFLGN